jgi:hypothetical protein
MALLTALDDIARQPFEWCGRLAEGLEIGQCFL